MKKTTLAIIVLSLSTLGFFAEARYAKAENKAWQKAALGAVYYDDAEQFLLATPRTPEQMERALGQYNNRPMHR